MTDHTAPSPSSASQNPTEFSFDEYSRNAHRFPAWMALTVFSAVCVAALDARRDIFNAQDTWPFVVACLSLILGFGSVVAYLNYRPVFVGQLPEIIVVRRQSCYGGSNKIPIQQVSVLLGFWASGLPIIMNPEKNIAVAKPEASETEIAPTVLNANLYFFSWLSLAAVIFLSGSLLQEFWGVDVRTTPAKSARWYGITASSLVVLGSCVRTYRAASCNDTLEFEDEVKFCRRTKLGISMGVIGFVLAAAMTALIQKMTFTVIAEFGITTFQLVLWCFAVGYITFGASPGATIGNLYFSTWIAFILSVFLFTQSLRDYVASREQVHNNETNGEGEKGLEAPKLDEHYDDAI